MNFNLATSEKEFLEWLSAHYFVKYRIIHTPKPPIVILRIFIEQKDSSIGITFEPFDRPGNVLDVIACQEELIVSAKLEYSNIASP